MEYAEFIKTSTVNNVTVWQSPHEQLLTGTLNITTHHCIVSSRTVHAPGSTGRAPVKKDVPSKQSAAALQEFWLLHSNVDVVEKSFDTTTSTPNSSNSSATSAAGYVTLKCKNLHIYVLAIPGIIETNNIAEAVGKLSQYIRTQESYPFLYRAPFTVLEDGWQMFSAEAEYKSRFFDKNDDRWRLSYVNRDYNVCRSYPAVNVVPRFVTDDVIIESSKFRHNARFPVLALVHPKTRAPLLRTSQPLVGMQSRRCREDERMLNSIISSSGGAKAFIIDLRSSAQANNARSSGGGYELEQQYPQWKRIHRPLEKCAQILESFVKLIDACQDRQLSADKWLSRLASNAWLESVQQILDTSCLVAQCLSASCPVIVHGADGRDTELIISSVVQILLNPDTRTLRGFAALIEREWLLGGHPFASRHASLVYGTQQRQSSASMSIGSIRAGNVAAVAASVGVGVPAALVRATQQQQEVGGSASAYTNKHENPTFLLFLDCVHQMQQQYCQSFEFNPDFLITLFEHSYSSEFGTFLFDSPVEREMFEVAQKTVSLWSKLNHPQFIELYLNPIYEPNEEIWPSVAPPSLRLWRQLYMRAVERESALVDIRWKAVRELVAKLRDLKLKALTLRKELAAKGLSKEELESAEMAQTFSPQLIDEILGTTGPAAATNLKPTTTATAGQNSAARALS